MFETGEYVVYGRTGICQVTGVTTMRVDGSSGEKLYYVLRPGGETDGKIFTSVEGGKQVLRGIITREEAERLIDEIPSIETLSIENEKFREDSYKKCIRTCECRDLLRIIKTIYVRKQARLSHGKKTTATDERYLKLAEDHLYSEFSMLLDIPKEHMADYIELDVQLTSDGEVIVMHDSNAYRTTGVDENIVNMTYKEVRRLDAGSWYSDEYKGEKVPGLREVLELAQGKIKLNIELKPADNGEELARKTVALIEKYNMENDCVITSFSSSALSAAKSCDENIRVGYILSAAYGDYYDMKNIDFFSVNAAFLSKRTIDAIHNSGKQVYAWTVNNKDSIKNLTNKGVDGVITDNPVLARETIYSRDTSETIVNMIRYVFNQ